MKEKLASGERNDSRPYALVVCSFDLRVPKRRNLIGLSTASKVQK
jgi:hypothetical protein